MYLKFDRLFRVIARMFISQTCWIEDYVRQLLWQSWWTFQAIQLKPQSMSVALQCKKNSKETIIIEDNNHPRSYDSACLSDWGSPTDSILVLISLLELEFVGWPNGRWKYIYYNGMLPQVLHTIWKYTISNRRNVRRHGLTKLNRKHWKMSTPKMRRAIIVNCNGKWW